MNESRERKKTQQNMNHHRHRSGNCIAHNIDMETHTHAATAAGCHTELLNFNTVIPILLVRFAHTLHWH